MAQKGKVLEARPDDRSLMLRVCLAEGEQQLQQAVL